MKERGGIACSSFPIRLNGPQPKKRRSGNRLNPKAAFCTSVCLDGTNMMKKCRCKGGQPSALALVLGALMTFSLQRESRSPKRWTGVLLDLYRFHLQLYHLQLLPRIGLTVERPNNAASRPIDGSVKQAVVRSSITPWRDEGKPQACFDSRKWTNRFSVKDLFHFFVASICSASSPQQKKRAGGPPSPFKTAANEASAPHESAPRRCAS